MRTVEHSNVKNLSDDTKKEAIAVTFKSSLPTFTANKSGITFTRAATDVDMKLSTTDTNLWGITNFTVTFKGGTTYSMMKAQQIHVQKTIRP